MARIYLVPLDDKTPNPLFPKNDEVNISTQKKEENNANSNTTPNVIINTTGIQDRIVSLPIDVSNYYGVEMANDAIYYIKKGSNDEKPTLYLYNLTDTKEIKIGEFDGFQLTADGKKMLLRKDKDYYIVDLPKSELKPEKKISFEQLKKAQKIIAIAGSLRKNEAILASVKSGYIDVLITDQIVAKELIGNKQ